MKKLKQAEDKEKKQEKEEKGSRYQEALPVSAAAGVTTIKIVDFKTYPQVPAPPLSNITSSIFQPPKIA